MKKIAILGLHLNYGGVEQAIVNQANALSDNYKIELVVTYKLSQKPAFEINSKVKIKYLTNVKTNKDEFLKYIEKKQYIKAFIEGLKSLKILHLKKTTMKRYIKNSDADILISSRIEITELLNKYAKNKALTIAEEHSHHNNNKKYIKRLQKACKNINYLVLVSKELTQFYKKKIKGAECVYIPNSLDKWPPKTSKRNTKNIISVGRLSKEKGFTDLIDVFKIIYAKDKDAHLHIIGFGNEYEDLKEKITKLNLSSSITLYGFQNKDFIYEKLSNSSLYLMCSFEESFGIVLIEAGACGVPAIAFNSAQGASEIIKNGVSGYLIKNRSKKEMAEKALGLLHDNHKLNLFGEEAQLIAKNYSFEEVKKQWLTFLNKISKRKD